MNSSSRDMLLIRCLDEVLCAVQEAYLSLTMKTVVFLRQVTELFEAQYIVKVDDDVFLRLDHLQLAIAQWHRANAGPPQPS